MLEPKREFEVLKREEVLFENNDEFENRFLLGLSVKSLLGLLSFFSSVRFPNKPDGF
jgi:hypothetical protein